MTLYGIAGLALLVVILSLPGIGIVLSLPQDIDDPSFAAVAAIVLGLLYEVVGGLFLLRFGVFSFPLVLALSVLPLVVAVTLRGRRTISCRLRAWGRRSRCLLLPASLALLVVAAVVLTPRWTFLLGNGMDAGNYEIYSNRFWTDGSLYFAADTLFGTGIPRDWVDFRNTWSFSGTVGRPVYLYAYPVLLGITKAALSSASVSWMLNAVIAGSTVFALVVLARRFVHSDLGAAVAVVPVVATPAFLYYSKQIMSELLSVLALTVVLIVLTEGRRERGGWSMHVTAGGGIALVMLTKIDLVVPVLMICFVAIALGAVSRRWSPPPATTIALAIGFVIAVGLDIWLTAPAYLDKVSPSTFIESLDQTALAGEGMLLILGLTTLSAAVLVARARPTRSWDALVDRGSNVAFWTFVVGWVAFSAWNLWVRPGGGSLAADHDPLNLVRLLDTYSPFVIGVLIVATPFLVREHGARRWLPVALVVALALVILDSNHSRSEVWWMRRYLALIVPGFVIVAGATHAWLAEHRGGGRSVVLRMFIVAAIVATGFQLRDMRPLFAHEVNTRAPDRLAAVRDQVPDGVPLVVAGEDPVITGLGNTLRSLRAAPTVIGVPVEQIPTAAAALGGGSYAVLSATALSPVLRDRLRLSLAATGMYGVQYQSWLREIAEDPAREELSRYHLYVRD